MASISTSANGNRTIQFVADDGKRRSIRLGKVSAKSADKVKRKVEAINGAIKNKVALDEDVANWLGKLNKIRYAKFVAVGLAKPRAGEGGSTLKIFVEEYITKRTDIKPNTLKNLNQAKRELLGYFGDDKLLVDVNEGDADEFRLKLKERLAENTVRRICGRARQFFKAAKKKRLLTENPFAEMKGLAVRANEERLYFLSREDATKVLDACPDAEWRVIFALARYGGLRCPSEHLELKWSDVDWAADRMVVRSPKTEHHEGKDIRIVPLFPELREQLEMLWEQAPKGAEYVISRSRNGSTNFRTQFERIILRAGLKPWPKLFQNLRSTRETELAETFPIKVVCEWIGNSEAVAKKHYLQVTEAHFQKAVQNPVQSVAVSHSQTQQPKQGIPTFTASDRVLLQCTSKHIPLRGVEPRFSD